MALHAHNSDSSHGGHSTQLQPQRQQPSYESNLSGSSEANYTGKTSQSIFSGQSSDLQNLERQHSIAVPTLNGQFHDASSQSVPLNSGSGPMATAPFLKDFNLVAEAARRAQMAVMMRELESVKL